MIKTIMKLLLVFALVFPNTFDLLSQESISQKIKYDSVYVTDIEHYLNMFVEYKIFLLNFQSPEKIALLNKFDSALLEDIKKIDEIYLDALSKFKNGYSDFMLRQGNEIYGYTYINTIILIENFLVRPDIYAILLNPARLSVNPKLDKSTKEASEKLIEQIQQSLKKIPYDQKKLLEKYFQEFEKGTSNHNHVLFKGQMSDEEREAYSLINFMIVLNRLANQH